MEHSTSGVKNKWKPFIDPLARQGYLTEIRVLMIASRDKLGFPRRNLARIAAEFLRDNYGYPNKEG